MLLSVVLTSLLQAGAGGPQPTPLAGLLPTPADLGGTCDYAPAPSRSGGGKRVTSGLWGGLAIPTNPWAGSNPELVGQVRARVVGPVRMPDGPPLDARDAARFLHAGAAGAYGYVAAYQRDNQQVLVYALQSVDLLEAGATHPPIRTAGDGSRVAQIRNAGVWVLISGRGGPCFEAVTRHVERWFASR